MVCSGRRVEVAIVASRYPLLASCLDPLACPDPRVVAASSVTACVPMLAPSGGHPVGTSTWPTWDALPHRSVLHDHRGEAGA